MKIEELMQSIPPELQGNISQSEGRVIITYPDGKGFCAYELAPSGTEKMGELKDFNRTEFESGSKIGLKVNTPCGL